MVTFLQIVYRVADKKMYDWLDIFKLLCPKYFSVPKHKDWLFVISGVDKLPD